MFRQRATRRWSAHPGAKQPAARRGPIAQSEARAGGPNFGALPSGYERWVELQRGIGNQGAARLLQRRTEAGPASELQTQPISAEDSNPAAASPGAATTTEPKLAARTIVDPFENEADRAVDHVMRISASFAGAPPQAREAPAAVNPSRGHIAARPSSLPMVSLQARLEVGSIDDPLEREAERVAGHVMQMPAPGTPPRCACRGTPGPDGECAACKASRAARPAITPAVPAFRSAPASVDAALSASGRPLDVATRAFFESRLDTDLSTVRIHDDEAAAVSAHDVAAQAYTVGRDVVFGAGRYQPGSEGGRALLAHELTHVVQQSSGRTSPGIQRKAQIYTIHPDHAPLSGGEVLILMAMTSRKVTRDAAIKLIKEDEYGCGEHPACLHGVSDTKPIQFTIGSSEPVAKHPAPAKRAPPKKAVAPDPALEAEEPAPVVALPAEIESALDDPYVKRFFTIGTQDKYLRLPAGQPNQDDYVSVNYVRDAILRLNEKELACYRLFAAEKTISTWTDLAKSLLEFGKEKADQCGAGDYLDPAPLDRLRGMEALYAAIKRKEALEKVPDRVGAANFLPANGGERARQEEQKRAREAASAAQDQLLAGADFATVSDFDRAANEFRLYFRTNAIRVAERMLFESGRVLQDAVRRYQIRGDQVPRDCQELYDELYRTYGGRSVDQLKDAHPILRNPAALHAVSPAKNVWEFSWRMTLFANERLRDLGFVKNNLGREPDVVFRWEPVVRATFDELGLQENSIHGTVIKEQLGKPGSTLGEKIVHYGVELLLFALSFVSVPVALTIAVAQATKDLTAGGIEYGEEMRASEQGFQKPPSLAPVFLAPALDLAPFAAHGAFKWFKGLRAASRVEKLAAAGASAERKLEQSIVRPRGAPEPTTVPHTETPPQVKTEPPVARPMVDVEPPVAPKPELAPVTTEPAARVPATEAPSVIKVDPRIAQAEERLATAQGKAETARARLGAASDKAAEAEQAKALAEAELAQARQEAKLARGERARAKNEYDRSKPGSKAGPRAKYTAAKNAAEKAESKVASAEKRVKFAKKTQGEAGRAVPRELAAIDRAEQAVTAAEEQRLIEAEADRIRKLPRTGEGLPPGWDYERFPNGPRRAWRPGDPINMPDAKGNDPVWATIRKRVWINRATDELEARAAGRVRATIPPRPSGPPNLATEGWEQVPKGGLQWLDPIREATDKELAAIAQSGSMPSCLGAEIEHARIPQRVGKMLEEVGVDPNTARRVTKVGDPDNLMPTRKEIHAIFDESAHAIDPNRNPKLKFSLDGRTAAPFREATDDEIAAIVKAIKDRKINLGKTAAGKRLRGFLDVEKKLRPSSTWEVP